MAAQQLSTDALLVNTAINFQRGLIPLTFRNHIFLKWLRRTGRVMKRRGGYDLRRNVGVDVVEATPYVRGQGWNFEPHSLERVQNFAPRGIEAKTSLALGDVIVNQGEDVIFDMFKDRLKSVGKGILKSIHADLHCDGAAAGNEARLEGLETVFTQDGTYAVTAADLAAIPEVTYAGLSTAPGAETSEWSGDLATAPNAAFKAATDSDWPRGTGKFLYDYYSPKLINARFTIGSDTGWDLNARKITRRAISILQNLGGVDEASPTIGLCGAEFFEEFKDNLDERTRELIPHQASREMGFRGAIEFEGAVIDTEYNCNTRAMYLINPNAVEMYYMLPPPQFQNIPNVNDADMFFGEGPVKFTSFYHYIAYFFGGMKWHPKYMCKIAEFT